MEKIGIWDHEICQVLLCAEYYLWNGFCFPVDTAFCVKKKKKADYYYEWTPTLLRIKEKGNVCIWLIQIPQISACAMQFLTFIPTVLLPARLLAISHSWLSSLGGMGFWLQESH